ncbi:MAG TPA: pilus assembly protein PilP [Chromatiales bacterium]|nr:pilus assembly protein PilP [Chromatiales bacterium]
MKKASRRLVMMGNPMTQFTRRIISCSKVLILVPLLSGCGGDGMQDLREYVTSVKSLRQGHVEPLPEIKTYESYYYDVADLRDPFRAEEKSKPAEMAATGSLHPDVNRRRETLESFSLDSLRMVGTLSQDGEHWAIVAANDKTVHRVVLGNYAGLNHGRITRISDNKIELTEIIADGLGSWNERLVSLALNDDN